MKITLAIAALLAAAGVYSQTPSDDAMDAQIREQLIHQPGSLNLSLTQPKPNEIKRDDVTYSGIVVELMNTDDPVQLINPVAPAEYGSSEDNTARDPITGEVSGLKLFSIRF